MARAHFSDADNIVDPKLRSYVWVDDPVGLEDHNITSKIQIDSNDRWDPNTIQQRPSILVSPGSVADREFLLGNGPAAGLAPISGNYEGKSKKVILEGKNTITVCGKYSMEASRIASEVFFRMLEYKSVIKEDLNFSEFAVKVLNEPKKVKENHEHWEATIDIVWAFVYQWRVTPQAPVFKKTVHNFNVF